MIGIYHVFEGNRKMLIEELSKESDFEFEEIDNWKKIQTADSELIVIFSPEFLPRGVSEAEFKNTMKGIDKTLVFVAYDISMWQMDRSRIFYLRKPNEKETLEKLKMILIMEIMGKTRELG